MHTKKMMGILCILLVAILLASCGNQPEESAEKPQESIENTEETAEEKEQPIAETSSRQILPYRLSEAQWILEEEEFPVEWVDAAKESISEMRGIDKAECTFTRGWKHDFTGDGETGGILLLRGLPDPAEVFMIGDSHFVYVNGRGEADYLTSGNDEETEDWYKMNGFVIQYPDFRHVVIHTGNQTIASGSWTILFREQEGKMVEKLSSNWFDFATSRYFFESGGVQGQGPAFHFWDVKSNQYATIAPVEMPATEFMRIFDSKNINEDTTWAYAVPEVLAKMVLPTAQEIESVFVYGNRYFHLLFTEEYKERYGMISMTWRYQPDKTWELYYGPHPGEMQSIHYGMKEGTAVFDVDMNQIEFP